jgi:hypothetical protein
MKMDEIFALDIKQPTINQPKFIELEKQSDATSGAGSAYLSGVPEFTPGF